MEKHELAVTELSSLLRMIQVIPDSDSVSRVQQMLLAFCTSWSTIGTRRAVLFMVDARSRTLRGHLAAERAEAQPGEAPSFDALARRVVENTQQIESGDLTLRTRTFSVPIDWQRCGAVKAALAGVPVLADRRLSEFASDPIFEFLDTASYVAVPLRVHGKVSSILVADNGGSSAPIGVEDISLLYSMAQQAATTTERLLDTADSARKFRVLRKLQDVLAGVDDTRRFGDSLSATLAMTARAAGSAGALVKDLVRNKTTHVKTIEEMDDSARETDLAVTECFEDILDRVAGSMKPVRGDSAHALLSDLAAERVRHFLAIPLIAGGECLGAAVFYVEMGTLAAETPEFPARDRLFLELCAGMLAERLDSLYRVEHVRRAERMLEEARSNWTREKVVSRAGARAQEQVDALLSEIEEIRDVVGSRTPFERRVEKTREVISRIDADTTAFRAEMESFGTSLEHVNLFELAREVFDPWALEARARGVEVTVRIGQRPPTLLMHRDSVRTALESILRVLAAHVDKSDRVLLEASAAEERVIIFIADTAGKVDGTLLSRLFLPFVSDADQTQDPGAMSAAGDILQRHAGEITVKSSPSWKTILAISFPGASNQDRRESRKDRRHRPGDRRQ